MFKYKSWSFSPELVHLPASTFESHRWPSLFLWHLPSSLLQISLYLPSPLCSALLVGASSLDILLSGLAQEEPLVDDGGKRVGEASIFPSPSASMSSGGSGSWVHCPGGSSQPVSPAWCFARANAYQLMRDNAVPFFSTSCLLIPCWWLKISSKGANGFSPISHC